MTARADLILANRAYLDHEAPRGTSEPNTTAIGGLLAALRPVIAPWSGTSGTTWIGAGRGPFDCEWVDAQGYELLATSRGPLRHRRLFFSEAVWNGHYGSVANSFLWPLLHLVREALPHRTGYYPVPVVPLRAEWAAHRAVNRAFASAACDEVPKATAWIHDYQLALAPAMLRANGYSGRIGFFLHTPFPDLSVATRYLDRQGLDCLREFIEGMLGADLCGLQSKADVDRFCLAAVRLCAAEQRDDGLYFEGRLVTTGAYPAGIDADELLAVAREAEPPSFLDALLTSPLPLVVGLDRADFTKGIPERLEAVAEAYRRGARFAYVGIAAPTRQGVAAYAQLPAAIATASDAAATAARETGNPFLHANTAITWPEVVALQRRADVMFTSSLADGLNLVPMQTAIAQSRRPQSERAVIITGRDAGVASAFAGFEADGMAPVDPLNADHLTRVLIDALAGRPGRVSDRLIESIRTNDALAWATRFLTDLEA